MRKHFGYPTGGTDTVPKKWGTASTLTIVSGTVYWTYFTPLTDLPGINQIWSVTGTTAFTGLTFARMGLATVADEQIGTLGALVARTADIHSTAFGTTSTEQKFNFDPTGGFAASYDLTAGTRYAAGLIITGTGMGNTRATGGAGAPCQDDMRDNAVISGQTDLVLTTLAGGNSMVWFRLLAT